MVWLLYSPFSAKCLDAESVIVTYCHYCIYSPGNLFIHRQCLLCTLITTNSRFPFFFSNGFPQSLLIVLLLDSLILQYSYLQHTYYLTAVDFFIISFYFSLSLNLCVIWVNRCVFVKNWHCLFSQDKLSMFNT